MSDEETTKTAPEPVKVLICPVCSLPAEYCEFGPSFDKCKPWLIANAAHLYPHLVNPDGERTDGKEEAVPAKQTGKKKKGSSEVPKILVKVESRNKKKSTTTIIGMEKFGIKLPEASKLMAKKFSCGCSVVKNNICEEIVIQGDFADDLLDMLKDKWQISADAIEVDKAKKKDKGAAAQ
ncbi:hypothetical protein PROFUN_05488 [Planoprotostelium fungivorum]|uniref:SUI1 domain-containing protein n=1 Tax=Planoprotostelium fungivorum TaxID=1890364 RepID=A0A2P6NQW4_9EUKA|nr:hypothetical protein PROFUN_05488 [Planoprotostelium fungivorum]